MMKLCHLYIGVVCGKVQRTTLRNFELFSFSGIVIVGPIPYWQGTLGYTEMLFKDPWIQQDYIDLGKVL